MVRWFFFAYFAEYYSLIIRDTKRNKLNRNPLMETSVCTEDFLIIEKKKFCANLIDLNLEIFFENPREKKNYAAG